MRNPAKIKKTYNYLIRLAIFLVTYGFIYYEIFYKRDLGDILDTLKSVKEKPGFEGQLSLVLLLMVVNWGLETKKWQYLISKIEKVPFIKSFEAVLTGVSVSVFTPNRIGEYFGRVFILEKASHIEGILVTILGSMSQLLITILTGTLSMLICILVLFTGISPVSGYIFYGLISLVVILDILLLLVYFNVSFLSTLKEKILRNRLKKFRYHFRVFAFFRFRELCTTITLSFFRYIVFSIQYYLLLRLFSVPVPFVDAILLISLVFFVVTAVPSVALTELGIRDSAALYFFGLYFTRHGFEPEYMNIGVLSASTLLWIINLAIPAIAGTFFVFRLKFFRKNTIE